MAVSDVTAKQISIDHFFLPCSFLRRWIWMAWAAGEGRSGATAVTLRVRRGYSAPHPAR